MPELPEVETIRRGIISYLINQPVEKFIIADKKFRAHLLPNIEKIMQGEKLIDITRRGKYLLFNFPVGTLIIHLGMSGSLCLVDKNHILQKHQHAALLFPKNTLVFTDPRKFGNFFWIEKKPLEHERLKDLGKEPFDNDFNGEYLFQKARNKKIPVKQFLMENKIVTGIGNIYASEILFAAKIKPNQSVQKISLKSWNKIAECAREILKAAIVHGGSTIHTYVNSRGESGGYQKMLRVYGKEGKKCPICKTIIKSFRLGQRSTFYCPRCQR
jgi:formamidopyrimidine-DNA glycosylase